MWIAPPKKSNVKFLWRNVAVFNSTVQFNGTMMSSFQFGNKKLRLIVFKTFSFGNASLRETIIAK